MNPVSIIDSSWNPIRGLLNQDPLLTLSTQILPNTSFQPEKQNIFRVFSMPLKDIKVVILGQDPYPTPKDAIGYAFATRSERRLPTSLRIIKTEIENEVGVNPSDFPEWKTLSHWIDSGVFLLNAALTVQTGRAGSHLKHWRQFTQRVISFISSSHPTIWVLWGRKAQAFLPYIDNHEIVKGYNSSTIEEMPVDPYKNYVLKSPHPAAESYSGGQAGFYNCNHFIYVNTILSKKRLDPIRW